MEKTNENGNSLIDAIMTKYGDMESGLHDMGDVKVYFNAPAKKTTSKEDNASDEEPGLRLPNILVLNRCQISKAGDRERIAALCGPVQELDLAENALQCWSEIGAITSEIPNLEFLNLSSNPLYKAPTPYGNLASMTTVRRLVLNNTKMPWDTVHSILRATPSLNELHLSLNDFSTVSQSPDSHTNVKLLQFNNNQISHWNEVQKLGRMFPDLETLVLMQNQIRSLDDCDPADVFPRLQMICLSETLLDSWEELDKLNGFPALTEVLIQGIPLIQAGSGSKARSRSEAGSEVASAAKGESSSEAGSEAREESGSEVGSSVGSRGVTGAEAGSGRDESEPGSGVGSGSGSGSGSSAKKVEEQKKKIRQLVIARLGKLTRLNRSCITEDEREMAERMFIRKFKDSAEKPPRYNELVRKHGQLQDLVNVSLSPRNVFQCEVLLEDQLLDELVDVNVKHTVAQLKKQLAPIVKIPASKIRVFLMEAGTNRDLSLCTEFNYPARFLHNYRIADGACFYIVPKLL